MVEFPKTEILKERETNFPKGEFSNKIKKQKKQKGKVEKKEKKRKKKKKEKKKRKKTKNQKKKKKQRQSINEENKGRFACQRSWDFFDLHFVTNLQNCI